MEKRKKTLLSLLIFFTSLSLTLIHSNYTNHIDRFNAKDEFNFEKILDEFQEIHLSTNGPTDKYNFKYLKIITINHTKVFGSSDYRNFPLLISIFDSDLHENIRSDGGDIAFANDTAWLDHEIEQFDQEYNSTHAQLIAWVRVPLLSVSVNTNITMYYGNPYLTSQENPTGVWDDNYKGVWHMTEVNAIDSTSNNIDGTENGGVSNLEGKIAGANYFEGVNELISIGNVGSGIKTIEFWMKPSNLGSGGFTGTSWKNPSATGDDYNDWNYPIYAFTSNDSYSIGAPNAYQDWYNFTFNIPNGATINGIEIKIEASFSSPAGAYVALSWNGGTTYTASSALKTWNDVGDANVTFGGAGDDWGHTWSSDELSNNNFRVRVQRSSQSTGNLAVDCISIKVYYNYKFMRIFDLDGISRIEIVEEKLLTTNFSGTTSIYIDGTIQSTLDTEWHHIAITITEGINVSAMEIGRVSSDYFDGIIDELRISDTLRKPESFNASYYHQNDPKSFYNITQEVQFNIDPPVFSNLTESSNIIELGNTETITINATDLSGIRQVLIEFEGLNHSMTNIGGDYWQYDTWTPSQIGNYTYIIFIEDNCNLWNSVSNSIKVIDTTPPTPPIMVIAPSSGTYSTLIFDWADGFDLSGIAFYNLVIDNESDPYKTPGFMVNINITNTGSNSSYYELSDTLTSGTYHYFLRQIDGVGLKSNFTTGSFDIISNGNGRNNITFLDVLPYILASLIGSIMVIIVLRKRIQKKIHPLRKKIPLKVIISHINEISNIKLTLQKVEHIDKSDDQSTFTQETLDEDELENRLIKIRSLGEELFNEGAYLEAQKQYEIAEALLLKLKKKDEALFYSKLITNIKNLNKEREDKLENLEKQKEKDNFIKVMEIYFEVIDISKKLKDFDILEMYQSELIQLVKDGNLDISDLEHKRNKFEEQGNIYFDQDLFEEAAEFFEYCEEISHVLLKLDRLEENYNIDKFRDKIKKVLKKIKQIERRNKS